MYSVYFKYKKKKIVAISRYKNVYTRTKTNTHASAPTPRKSDSHGMAGVQLRQKKETASMLGTLETPHLFIFCPYVFCRISTEDKSKHACAHACARARTNIQQKEKKPDIDRR